MTFANSGIVLRSSPDEIPLTAYKALVNVITDRENTISVRRGFQRLNNGLPSAPYSSYYLKDMEGQMWRYAVTARQLYVAPVTNPGDAAVWPIPLGTDFAPVIGAWLLSAAADPRPIFTTYTLYGQETKPYMFMADGSTFLKHSGGMDAARWIGIPRPSPFVSITLEPNAGVMIEACNDASEWTVDNTVVTDVGTAPSGAGINITLIAGGDGAVGGCYKDFQVGGIPVLLDLGMNDLEELIELWVKFPTDEDALNCAEIVVSLGMSLTPGDTTFATRFEKAIAPSSFEAASQIGSAGRTQTYGDSTTDALNRVVENQSQNLFPQPPLDDNQYERLDPELDPSIYYDQVNQFSDGQTTLMRPGSGVWNLLRIKKKEFTRVGQSALTAPDLNWNTISAVRIDLKLISPAVGGKNSNVQLDDLFYLTTGRLYGVDYQWVYTYYDSLTDTESDYSEPTAVPYPGANHDQYLLRFASCPDNVPPLANPDKIRIYRIGGTISQFQFVDEILFTPGVFPALYIDNIGDWELGDVLETDNQLPPEQVKGVCQYDNRLWTWGGHVGGVPEPPNRLRFSKNVRVEHFPTNQFILVGTGSEEIQNVIENDGELFVFTLTRVYRVTGSGDDRNAVSTPVNQGLKTPHALARGTRSIYMYAYDGIYEFPSGRKISEPINQVFFNETVNEIAPIALGRETLSSMAFWDSRVYFSYCATDDPAVGPDRMLVWDTIYERWHWYIYGAQAMFMEPENNILVGCNLVQWDSIVDGHAANFHYSGGWPMQMESGYADHCDTGLRGIFWDVDTREYDLGMPDQEKRFIDLVLDADTQGTPVLIQAGFDLTGAPNEYGHDSIGNVTTVGRQRIILPILMGENESKLATRIALRVMSNTAADATSATRLYKIIHRFLIEPIRHRTHVTDWSDYGTPGPKFFRELWVDIDNFNQPLDSIEVHVDQTVRQVLSQVPAVNGQTRLYFGMDLDMRGTLGRLKFIPMGENEVKVYGHSFQVIPEPPKISTIQTPWSDEDWPYDKLWKEVVLDIDTGGIQIGFDFWLDGAIKESWEVTTLNGRALLTHSLAKDMFGKLGRVTVAEAYLDSQCCLPQGVIFYGVKYVIDKEPADVTFSDSYDYVHGFDRLKILRRLWLAMKNPDCDVNLDIYADEVLVSSKTIALESLATGFSKRRIDIEGGIKGMLFRFIFSGNFGFKLYWERSEWEIRDLNTEEGYRRERLIPPMTM